MTAEGLIGSVALLKTGGPAMTVWEVRPRAGRSDLIHTEWFAADGHLRKDCFDVRELVILPKGEA